MLVTWGTRIVSPTLDLTAEAAGPEKTGCPQVRPVSFRQVAKSEPLAIGEYLSAGRDVRVGSERRCLIRDIDGAGYVSSPSP